MHVGCVGILFDFGDNSFVVLVTGFWGGDCRRNEFLCIFLADLLVR